MIFIGVDPGSTTGLAILQKGYQSPELREMTATDAVSHVHMLLTRWGSFTVVICERYTITAHTGELSRQYAALEIIGALRYLTHIHNAQFTLQSRSAKSRVSNELLRDLDWRQPANVPMEGHALDAARHLLVGMTKIYTEHDAVRRALTRI